MRFARDNTDFATRATMKGATICCAQGQNIYVDKRGAYPPMPNQT